MVSLATIKIFILFGSSGGESVSLFFFCFFFQFLEGTHIHRLVPFSRCQNQQCCADFLSLCHPAGSLTTTGKVSLILRIHVITLGPPG